MSNTFPQPTAVLVKRLRRVAQWLDGQQQTLDAPMAARANTCWQAAARLEALSSDLKNSVDR